MNLDSALRDPAVLDGLAAQIAAAVQGRVRLMEVCGTHSHQVARFGLKQKLPAQVELISGPGCPVCVTAQADIDRMILLAEQPNVIVATFGDMVRVPGTNGSLATARARGAEVQVVYSALDAVKLAQRTPDKDVVFIAIGFETTAPVVAAAALEAERLGVGNFSLLSLHKLIPPAMELLLADADLGLDGFLCPGHVSVVIGADAYRPLAERFRKPFIVAGFEPADILTAVLAAVRQLAEGRAEVENVYERAVRPEGNPRAREVLNQVFEVADAQWRGLGLLPASGLVLRPRYAAWDAGLRFELPEIESREHPACRCGEVLQGRLPPSKCPAFGRICTPEEPLGPCMVSSEGACAAVYRYREAGAEAHAET